MIRWGLTAAIICAQFRCPPDGPDLLGAWIVALALYDESHRVSWLVYWAACARTLPHDHAGWIVVGTCLLAAWIRRQRYALGRDHLFTRCVLILTMASLPWAMELMEGSLAAHTLPWICTQGLLTLGFGLSLMALVRRLVGPLGLRQTRWDF